MLGFVKVTYLYDSSDKKLIHIISGANTGAANSGAANSGAANVLKSEKMMDSRYRILFF